MFDSIDRHLTELKKAKFCQTLLNIWLIFRCYRHYFLLFVYNLSQISDYHSKNEDIF